MSWNIPIIAEATPPAPLSWKLWLALFFIFSSLLLLTCVFVYFLNLDAENYSFVLFLFLGGSVFFILLASLRIYRHSVVNTHYEAWVSERNALHIEWQYWAQDAISVLSYSMLFPEKSCLSKRENKAEVQARTSQTLLLSTEGERPEKLKELYSELLAPMREILMHVSQSSSIEVNFIYNASSVSWPDFMLAWRELGLKESVLSAPVYPGVNYCDSWNSWYKKNDSTVILAVIVQFHEGIASDDCKGKASESAAAWLISPSVSTSSAIKPQAFLHRPLLSDKHSVPYSIKQMADFQLCIFEAQEMWLSDLDQDECYTVIKSLCDNNIDTDTHTLDQNFFDLMMGTSGEITPWFVISAGIMAVREKQKAQLVCCGSDQHILFSLVSLPEHLSN